VIPGNDDSAKAVRCTPVAWPTPSWKARPTPPQEVVKAVAAADDDEFVEVENASA
jgi:hypothetical protein